MEKAETIDTAMPEEMIKRQPDTDYGELVKIEYGSHLTTKLRRAQVLLPPEYGKEKEYPVVYLLHGVGGDEKEWFFGHPQEIIGNLIKAGEIPEIIAVFPNERVREDDRRNPPDVFGLQHFQAFDRFLIDLEQNLMPFMKCRFQVREGREHTAIAGFSMGGREALFIGFQRPELFGYIGAFSPAFGLFPYTNNGVTEEGLIPEDKFKISQEYPTFVMIMTGKHDDVIYREPERYHRALVKNKMPHLYYEIPGGHDFEVWDNGLYHFLKKIF